MASRSILPPDMAADPPDHAHAWLYARTRQGKERGPAPARRVLDALGRPDERFDSLRVVGTNGKGSVCAMLEAGLLAAGGAGRALHQPAPDALRGAGAGSGPGNIGAADRRLRGLGAAARPPTPLSSI